MRPPAAGKNHCVERGARRPLPQEQLHKADGNESPNHPENGVENELHRVNQLVGGDVEQRFIAQNEMQNDPRRRRAENDRSQDRRVHVAHHLFEGEQHRRDRCIEGSGQRRGRAGGNERLDARRRQPKLAAEAGCDAGAHMNRRTLAAQSNSAGQRDRTQSELAEDCAKADETVSEEKGSLRLWNPASARVRKVAEQQKAGCRRSDHWHKNPPPRRTAGWVHARSQILGQDDEGNDDEADYSTDDERQDKKYLVLMLIFEGIPDSGDTG